MNLYWKYWYFKEALSPKICDEIIRLGLSHKHREEIAVTGEYGNKNLNKKQLNDLKKTRNSNITWLNDPWIYQTIHPFVNMANKNADWNFDWDWSESCQFTRYSKGQFYNWHCDSWENIYEKPGAPEHGKIRKLSVIVSLLDPKDYKGGELEFDYRNKEPNKKSNLVKCTEITPRGSIVVFPSFMWHRVCPVKKGTRYSLVMWNLGYPFK